MMKPEEQRKAIAKACGWKSFPYCIINGIRKDVETWLNPQELEIGFTQEHMPSGTYGGRGIPNYLEDLNAMAEAVKTIVRTDLDIECCEGAWVEYGKQLCNVCGYSEHERAMFSWVVYNATAAQRAEAFLKTIGKWVE
jgi:hypothetical protein